MRHGNSVGLGVAAVAGVLLCAGATWSRPARSDAPCSACNQRVAALEVRVGRLEKRMAALQAQLGTARPATSGAPATAKAAPQGPDNVKVYPPVGGCSPPYSFDAKGIQKPKPGCEDIQSSPCDPPYVIDAEGLRRPKPECLH
jgi:hypothetical protein